MLLGNNSHENYFRGFGDHKVNTSQQGGKDASKSNRSLGCFNRERLYRLQKVMVLPYWPDDIWNIYSFVDRAVTAAVKAQRGAKLKEGQTDLKGIWKEG